MNAVRSDLKCHGFIYALACSGIILILPAMLFVAILKAVLLGKAARPT